MSDQAYRKAHGLKIYTASELDKLGESLRLHSIPKVCESRQPPHIFWTVGEKIAFQDVEAADETLMETETARLFSEYHERGEMVPAHSDIIRASIRQREIQNAFQDGKQVRPLTTREKAALELDINLISSRRMEAKQHLLAEEWTTFKVLESEEYHCVILTMDRDEQWQQEELALANAKRRHPKECEKHRIPLLSPPIAHPRPVTPPGSSRRAATTPAGSPTTRESRSKEIKKRRVGRKKTNGSR